MTAEQWQYAGGYTPAVTPDASPYDRLVLGSGDPGTEPCDRPDCAAIRARLNDYAVKEQELRQRCEDAEATAAVLRREVGEWRRDSLALDLGITTTTTGDRA